MVELSLLWWPFPFGFSWGINIFCCFCWYYQAHFRCEIWLVFHQKMYIHTLYWKSHNFTFRANPHDPKCSTLHKEWMWLELLPELVCTMRRLIKRIPLCLRTVQELWVGGHTAENLRYPFPHMCNLAPMKIIEPRYWLLVGKVTPVEVTILCNTFT